MKSIQSLFAYIATHPETGDPFVPVLHNETTSLKSPMFFISRETADDMRPQAQMVANQLKSPVVLAEFTRAQDLDTIQPENQPN